MKQFLIPSGEIAFHGNQEQLLQAITKVNGILMADQQFRCVLTGLESKPGISVSFFHQRGLSFRFSCKYNAVVSGFRVTYQVYPSILGMLLLLIPVYTAYAGYVQFAPQGTGWYGLLAGLVFAAVFYPFFFLIRKRCVQQFLAAFHN